MEKQHEESIWCVFSCLQCEVVAWKQRGGKSLWPASSLKVHGQEFGSCWLQLHQWWMWIPSTVILSWTPIKQTSVLHAWVLKLPLPFICMGVLQSACLDWRHLSFWLLHLVFWLCHRALIMSYELLSFGQVDWKWWGLLSGVVNRC